MSLKRVKEKTRKQLNRVTLSEFEAAITLASSVKKLTKAERVLCVHTCNDVNEGVKTWLFKYWNIDRIVSTPHKANIQQYLKKYEKYIKESKGIHTDLHQQNHREFISGQHVIRHHPDYADKQPNEALQSSTNVKSNDNQGSQQSSLFEPSLMVTNPTLLWWAPVSGMVDHDAVCEQIMCKISVNQSVYDQMETKALLFYGSQFELTDLPVPRRHSQIWALKHEESPKNNDFLFSHSEMMTLFNYTSTFKRESDYPITTQDLPSIKWLQSKDFVVPLAEKNKLRSKLAPVLFIHSDCGVPSDRETYLNLLQAYIKVDSYGACSNNKQLPEHLRFSENTMAALHKVEFLRFVANYKFTMAMENAVCDDYITEKLWRSLHVGSIPIVFGSPNVKDFLPSNKSAIVVNDFDNVSDLASLINHLDNNDLEYTQYLTFKEQNGVTNKFLLDTLDSRDWSVFEYATSESNRTKYYSHYDGFECFICRKIHENLNLIKQGQSPITNIASDKHYGCPKPGYFNRIGQYRTQNVNGSYPRLWSRAKLVGQAFRHFYDKGIKLTNQHINQFVKMHEK